MPTPYAIVEGKFVPLEDAKISIMTHGFLYGTAIFEGIRAYYNEKDQEMYVVRLLDHYVRLKKNCPYLKIDLKETSEEWAALTVELLRKCNYHEDVYIRPVVYKSAKRIGLKLDDQDAFLIFAVPMGSYLSRDKALQLMTSSWRRVEDNAIPARCKVNGGYVNLAVAAAEARENGFDEAILLNENGSVSEAAGMNIFMIRNGKLITPAITENVLEGLTRGIVFHVASDLKIPYEERPIDRSELYVADEVFLCGTGAEISGAGTVDRRKIGDGKIGPITRKLQEIYWQAVRGELPQYKRWLTPIYHV